MKISYLTKCPKCGGNIDEELSRFCLYCGQSLLVEEPEDDIDKEKLYSLEDRTLPFKKINNIDGNYKKHMNNGWGFIIAGIISLAMFALIPIVALIIEPLDWQEGLLFVLLFELGMILFAGWPLIVGIAFFMAAGNCKRKEKDMLKNPDKIYHGVIRGYSARVTNPKTHIVITTLNIKVEKPTPVLFFVDIVDEKTRYRYQIDEKVVLYRKEDDFIVRKETILD